VLDANSNVAAWMISSGLKWADPAAARNDQHLRAVKASQAPSSGLISRLAAAITAVRPGSARVEPACCPA
jgi:hypothetical protein